MDLEKIIEEARQQQDWTVSHKFNFGPVKYLRDRVVHNNAGTGWAEYEKSLDVFEQNVRRVTDAETYFAWEHSSFDIYVDADLLVCKMRRAFPDVSFMQVVKWLNKHEAPHQYTKGISPALVPDEIKRT